MKLSLLVGPPSSRGAGWGWVRVRALRAVVHAPVPHVWLGEIDNIILALTERHNLVFHLSTHLRNPGIVFGFLDLPLDLRR